MWADELRHAIDEAAEHLSLYQLTIEEGTPFFGLHQAGKLKTPDEAARARALRRHAGDLRQARAARLRDFQSRAARRRVPAQSGLLARRGICRHRPRRARPASTSTACRHATATEKRPEAWLMRVETNGHGVVTDDLLNSEERADEFLLMGLRLAEGIDPERYSALSGRPLDPGRIALLREEGAITVDATGRLARDEQRISGAGCGGRGSGGLASCRSPEWSAAQSGDGLTARDCPGLRRAPSRGRHKSHLRPKTLRRARDRNTATLVVTFITARPRSLVPSARKRNRPSMPAKPEGLVSTSARSAWCPCVRASAATRATAS